MIRRFSFFMIGFEFLQILKSEIAISPPYYI